MTIKRKLSALGYTNIDVDIKDQNQIAQLIVWLDENKLKYCSGEEKKSLSDHNSSDWNKHLEDYRNKLKCPVSADKKEACLDWILGLAVQTEYSENGDRYNKFAVDCVKTANVPNVVADNPLDHLNFTSPEFQEGINKLANILKVPPHPDPLVTLEACSKIIQRRLHSRALEKPSEHIIKGTPFPYKSTDLGFEMNDTGLNEAAKLMRLLYIQDLRNLQTKVNECIVAVQSVTANPKTDTKLGKVGK